MLIPLKGDPRENPPLISVANGLTCLGHDVRLFSYHCDPVMFEGAEQGLLKLTMADSTPYPTGSFARRLAATLKSRRHAARFFRNNKHCELVWVGSWDYRDLKRMLRASGVGAPIVYQCNEYEPERFQWCREADYVVVPEENRAWLTQIGAGLARRPFVLPNIPAAHPRSCTSEGDETMLRLTAAGHRIALYQGYMDAARRCLPELIQAVGRLPEAYVLVLMPSRPMARNAEAQIEAASTAAGVANRVYLIPSRVPPEHLEVVGQAYVGVGLYRPTSLNQIYCAPNRLYEFTGFGIPVVLPDYPGISKLAAKWPGILTCDPESPASIARAILQLDDPRDRARHAEGAREFFEKEGRFIDRLRRILEAMVEEGHRSRSGTASGC